MYQKGADMILWGARIKRGQIPLWIEGSGGMLGVLHVTGVAGAGGGSSTATVKLTGPRNTLVDVFYDTAAGPSILLESGASSNQCIGMNFRNRYSAGTFPVIRCDASGGQVLNNLFDGFFTDDAGGDGWSSLIEMIGGPGDLAGNVLGRGHADSCRALWNTRPSLVGDIVSDRRLTRNSGSATLSSGTRSLKIPHGLKGAPLSVTVSMSKGSAPNPDLAVDATTIDLSWPAALGSLVVYWRAEM
jgi:hypothetical protein